MAEQGSSHPWLGESELVAVQGEALAAARIGAGLSLSAAAELIGVSRRELGDLEQGRGAGLTADGFRSALMRLENATRTGSA